MQKIEELEIGTTILDGKYKVRQRISNGSHGVVYKVQDVKSWINRNTYAAKVDRMEQSRIDLQKEMEFLNKLKDSKYVPKVYSVQEY